MVCHRCKMVVKDQLEKIGLHPLHIGLGEVMLEEKHLTVEQMQALSSGLTAAGFELMDDRQSRLIEQIKTFIIQAVHYDKAQPDKKFSDLLSQHVHHEYSYISKLFSDVEGITIEHFIISQKIEKVKELLMYNELSLSQIAFDMHYSSTAYLSNQFKRVTGLTPSAFKQSAASLRQSLDKINTTK